MSRRLHALWAARSLWWALPAALAVIAAQQGIHQVGLAPLGAAIATVGRLAWPILVIAWPLLVAAGVIGWQIRRRAHTAGWFQPDLARKTPGRPSQRPRPVVVGLAVTAAALLTLGAVLVVLPVLLVPARAIANDQELYKARSDVRATLVQVLAGGLVATGLIFTARTLDLNRSGQVTERFTRAVDQLGQRGDRPRDRLDVRLGGIYALERIARDSPDDLSTVVEVLCAHVREYTPWPPRLPGQGRADLTPDQVAGLPDLQTRAPDLQAVLTVLGRLPDGHSSRAGRRGRARAASNPVPRDLTRTDLRRADLRGAHLEGADLRDAHLEAADLRDAHLEEADLYDAHLEGTRLGSAHLEGADLPGAHLEEADLRGAHLEGADLRGAHLEGADLYDAHLEGTDLRGAHLEEAYLHGAHLEAADLEGAILEGAILEGTHMDGADLEGTDSEEGGDDGSPGPPQAAGT